MPIPFIHFLFVTVLLLAGNGFAADEEEEKPRRGFSGKGFVLPDRGGAERMMESLSDEERQKIRKAVGEVWSNPEVKKAREEMARAGDSLKAALRSAVEEEDPEVREILKRMLSRGGENGGPRMGTGGMVRMEAADRKVLDEARTKAMQLDVVVAARENQSRVNREFSELLYREMVKIDPRVEAILEKRARLGGEGERVRPGGAEGRRPGMGGPGPRGPFRTKPDPKDKSLKKGEGGE